MITSWLGNHFDSVLSSFNYFTKVGGKWQVLNYTVEPITSSLGVSWMNPELRDGLFLSNEPQEIFGLS